MVSMFRRAFQTGVTGLKTGVTKIAKQQLQNSKDLAAKNLAYHGRVCELYAKGEKPTRKEIENLVHETHAGSNDTVKGAVNLGGVMTHTLASKLPHNVVRRLAKTALVGNKFATTTAEIVMGKTMKDVHIKNMYNYFINNNIIHPSVDYDTFKSIFDANKGAAGMFEFIFELSQELDKSGNSEEKAAEILKSEKLIYTLADIASVDLGNQFFTNNPGEANPNAVAMTYPTQATKTLKREGGSSCSRKHKKSRKGKKGKNGKRVTRKHRGGAKKTRKSNKNTKRKHKHRRTKRKC